ncbi:MAG TPA: hypothetical protein VH596_12205 [Terriglobales bacterium]
MKTRFGKITLILGVVLLGAMFTATANAACGGFDKPAATLHRQSWDLGVSQPASLLNISDRDNDPIVGMWHVTFTAEGNAGGPPNDTPIDNAMVVWHNDGTEIMNSNRPAQDGNFCLGVWEKTGRFTYKLNHMPWAGNDPANAPSGIGNPQGGAQIVEHINLSPDRNHYAGWFTLDAYDPSGNSTAHIVGVINATRVTVNTNVKNLL